MNSLPDLNTLAGARAWKDSFEALLVWLGVVNVALVVGIAILSTAIARAKKAGTKQREERLTPHRRRLNRVVLLLVVFTAGIAVAHHYIGNRVDELAEVESERQAKSISRLSKELATTKQSVGSTEALAAQAQSRAEQAEEEVRKLKEEPKPRRLLGKDRTRFVAFLKGYPPQTARIASLMNDAETHLFTLDLVRSIEEAGWIVEDVGISRIMITPPLIGVRLRVQDRANIPVPAEILGRAFNEIGIKPGVRVVPNLKEGWDLQIGQKPP